MKILRKQLCVPLVLAMGIVHAAGAGSKRCRQSPLAHDIFKQLIEVNTTDSVGNVTTAAEAMARRLRDAGFPEKDIMVAGPNERKKNLVVRIHGAGKRKAILFIGHLDVVEARRELDYRSVPNSVEKDGFFYGRGSGDMKEGDAMLISNFIRLRKEHYVPGPRPDLGAHGGRGGRRL